MNKECLGAVVVVDKTVLSVYNELSEMAGELLL